MSAAFLDGDIIAYVASATAQDNVDWGDGEGEEALVDIEKAIDVADRMVREWHRGAGTRAKPIVCLSPEDRSRNFRKALSPTYKSQRKGSKPVAYPHVVEWLQKQWTTVILDWCEADDALGIFAMERQGIMVSTDKDLQTIPARLFNPNKDRRPRRITTGMADRYFFTQALTGDAVDGYPGCKGIGIKKSTAALEAVEATEDAMWAVVLDLFGDYDTALEQCRMARILRYGEYDANGAVKLWLPGGERETVTFDQLEQMKLTNEGDQSSD